MRVPDLFEAITAYRAWTVWPNGLLTGQAATELWPPYQPLRARCSHVGTPQGAEAHIEGNSFLEAPVLRCTCGIHALKDKERAEDRVDGPIFGIFGGSNRPSVFGTVRLWGRVIEHESGYRAEFAYPAEIYCAESQELTDRISRLYGIPAHYRKPQKDSFTLGYDFYINPRIIYGKAPRRLGVITSLGDDIEDKPAIIKPAQPNVAPQHIVRANRWQLRQYGGVKNLPLYTVDWRSILRQMVFGKPRALDTLDIRRVDIFDKTEVQL